MNGGITTEVSTESSRYGRHQVPNGVWHGLPWMNFQGQCWKQVLGSSLSFWEYKQVEIKKALWGNLFEGFCYWRPGVGEVLHPSSEAPRGRTSKDTQVCVLWVRENLRIGAQFVPEKANEAAAGQRKWRLCSHWFRFMDRECVWFFSQTLGLRGRGSQPAAT